MLKYFACTVLLLLIASDGKPVPATSSTPVLVELFTSEGCSSCPPADRLLAELDAGNSDVIVLSEHVDYWNYLGWSDPFSSAAFSAREQRYSDLLGESVYTPQVVVDGAQQALGSDRRALAIAIAKAASLPKLPMNLTAKRSGGFVSLQIEAPAANGDTELLIAIAADHERTQVLKGENGGRALDHVAVVRSLTKSGKWEGIGMLRRDVTIPIPTGSGGYRAVAFLQNRRTGHVVGAAKALLRSADF